MPKRTLYYDPPELASYQLRGAKSPDQWKGIRRSRYDVMAACGDSRDWFRYFWRYEAFCRYWALWADAWNRRRGDIRAGFDFNLILIIGPYGRGKTTLGVYEGVVKWAPMGHPTFSNTACLWGWQLADEELYTAIVDAPKHSVFLLDEASASFSSGMNSGLAITLFGEQLLNTRKQDIKAIFMSAQDHAIARRIRQEIYEVWMPIPKDQIHLVGQHYGVNPRLPAANPDNFRTAWFVWTDFPYRRNNLIEDSDGRGAEGFGRPSYILYQDGDPMRDAYMLTDTFELAKSGMSRVQDNSLLKNIISTQLGREDAGAGVAAKIIDYVIGLGDSFVGDGYLTATEMSETLGIASSQIGRELRTLFPSIQVKRGKGYQISDLVMAAADRGYVTRDLETLHLEKDNDRIATYLAEAGLNAGAMPEWITATQIGNEIGIDAREVGKAIAERFGVRNVQRYGYNMEELFAAYRRAMEDEA